MLSVHVPQDVLSGFDLRGQFDGPGAVLRGKPFAGPRDRFGGVVSGLIDLHPDGPGAAGEGGAFPLAVGEVGQD